MLCMVASSAWKDLQLVAWILDTALSLRKAGLGAQCVWARYSCDKSRSQEIVQR